MIPPRPVFRSLRTRLTMLYAALFTVGFIVLAIVAQVMIERGARRSAVAELAASGKVYDRLWQERERSLIGAADVVARDFGFRSAVASGDVATIGSALDSLRARAGVGEAVLVDTGGRVIGDAGRLRDKLASVPFQLGAERRDAVIASAGRAYRIVTAPVMAPIEIGRIVFIVPLDAGEMRSLERLSAIPLDARVLTRDAGGWIMRGERLPGDLQPGGVQVVDLARRTSFALLRPLPGAGGAPEAALLLTYPMGRAMAPYRSIQVGLVLAGLLWLGAVVYGSGQLAHGITRPIRALDRAARRLERGERVEVPVETHDEVGRLSEAFNAMSRGIVEREERITHLAFHDTLTDLPNLTFFREALEQEIARADRRGEALSLLHLDLDGFKGINDALGHAIGDQLLTHVAKRLVALAGDGLVARLGSDEFAVVLTDTADRGRSRRLARAILEAAVEPVELGGHPVETGVSIGISLFPDDAGTADALVKNADLALHRAKHDGRGVFRYFEQALDAAARRRRRIEADLRVAIRTGQLELAFQPIVGSGDETIKGFEALLRWPHPDGLVSPVEFIPVAEESGLIVPLGEWVLHEACRVAATWPDHVRVAVNVSPLQFRSPGFQAIVLQALTRSGLAPNRLEIEITESVFIDGEEGITHILHGLRALGVRVALDDFGTGYSSLSYLRSFPFDKLKIDRSFVINIAEDEGAAAIVKAILDLAAALRMETTAEGIENAAQHAELRARGCDTLQGFLFSRPVTGAAATTLACTDRGGVSARAA